MPGGPSPTRHYCDHAECGKSFRRAEHLTRHKLNHTDSTIQCPQCDRLFYRRDLLHRHVSLKHGKSPRASARPSIDRTTLAHPDTTALTAVPLMNGTTPFAVADVDAGAVDHSALPVLEHLFPFPSPPLDLADDWASWSHHNPNPPVAPVGGPDPVAGQQQQQQQQMDSNGDMAELQQCLDYDWMNPASPENLYVSQDVYDFLVTLGAVVGENYHLTIQDVNSVMKSACQFIMESLPIFHRPTFSFDLVQKELCASIFCVGLLISHEQPLHHIGCTLLGQTRSSLLQHVHENAIYLGDLGILQAMLLVEFSGMYLADRTAMELSDIFHGTLVTISRRLGLFEITPSTVRAASASGDESEWQSPVEYESAKRLAYFVFALDVEQSLFFGHERSILSTYAMKLELPSEEGDWHVPSQRTHTKLHGATSRAKFHLLCHSILSKPHGHTSIPPNLPQLSNLTILLGLSSVALDLLRRQQDPFFDTKQSLSCLRSALPAMHSRLLAGPEGPMKTHGRAVYHITVIALCTPLDDLERAANDGFSRTGCTPRHRTRAALIRLLARKVGPEPARHAVQLLRLFLTPPAPAEGPPTHGFMAGPSPAPPAGGYSPYEPSALYFGVLTLWAYIIGRVGDHDGEEPQVVGDDDGGHHHHGYLPDNGGLRPAQAPGASSVSIASSLRGMEESIEEDDDLACRGFWRAIMQNATARLAARRNNNAQEYSQVLGSLSDNLSF